MELGIAGNDRSLVTLIADIAISNFCEIYQFWSLREKCPNAEFFLVRIFWHLNWIRRDTYFSVFSPNAGKYGPENTPYFDTFHAVGINNFWPWFFTKSNKIWITFPIEPSFECAMVENWFSYTLRSLKLKSVSHIVASTLIEQSSMFRQHDFTNKSWMF